MKAQANLHIRAVLPEPSLLLKEDEKCHNLMSSLIFYDKLWNTDLLVYEASRLATS